MAGLDPAIHEDVRTMHFMGMDGYSRGWVAVWIDNGQRGIRCFSTLAEALGLTFDRAMIDMPIGLPEPKCGYRRCDEDARKKLGTARSRVFLGARRSLLQFAQLPYSCRQSEANHGAKLAGEKGVCCQLAAILPKIAEVDAAMSVSTQERVRETHPELVFYRLNNYVPLAATKKSERGALQRRALLIQDGFENLDAWLGTREVGVACDDVLDACACAIAARDMSQRIPDVPELDARDLRMEMWF
jgi:predicted RNase H-like nuclease